MKREKTDLRILKTRKAIKNAFITLIQTKGYERITIQDIADEAMINRNTFYLHYIDKVDLMESLCKDSLDRLKVCINLEIKDIDEMNEELFTLILTDTFKVIAADIVFFKAMLSDNGHPNFANYLKETLKSFMLTGLVKFTSDYKMNVTLEYMISGLVGVICVWITHFEELQITEIVDQLSNIHFHNALNLLKRSKAQ